MCICLSHRHCCFDKMLIASYLLAFTCPSVQVRAVAQLPVHMPSFATTTVVHDNTDTVHFELHARYVCVAGTPSDVVYAVRDIIPSSLDVVLQSDLVISLSGTLNGTRHQGRDMQTSVISQHVLGYFHAVCFTALPRYVTTALILRTSSSLPRASCTPNSFRIAKISE